MKNSKACTDAGAKAEQVDPRALPDVACVMDGDQEVCGEGAWPTPRPPHLIKRRSIKRLR